jgi:hypothetical protein
MVGFLDNRGYFISKFLGILFFLSMGRQQCLYLADVLLEPGVIYSLG